jgi:hypothetical protein
MNNPYTSIFAPQSMQGGDMSPQMMNISGREGLQNALNSQGGQLAQQALHTGQSPASGVNPFALAQALRQGASPANPYGATPQGGYSQQDQYMKDAMANPQTQQQQMLMNQGGPEMMSFNNSMPSGQ